MPILQEQKTVMAEENANIGPVLYFSPGIFPCVCAGMELFDYHMVMNLAKDTPLVLATCCRASLSGIRTIHLNRRLFGIRRLGLSKLSLIISSLFRLLAFHPKPSVICVSATSSSGYYGYIFRWVKRLRSIPYIVVMHCGELRPWRRLSGNHVLFNRASRILAVSQHIRDEISRRCGRPVDIVFPLLPFVKNNVPAGELKRKLGLEKQDRVLLSVGSLKELKGVADILGAFLSLGDEYISTKRLFLVFAGDGPQRKVLKSQASQSASYGSIRFLGNIPHTRIQDIYGASDIFVMASRCEGTPLALLEAEFNGLAIVASNVRGIDQLIREQENGLLFPHGDREGLAMCIRSLVEDVELADRLGRSAKAHFHANFDYQRTITTLKRTLNNSVMRVGK